MTALPSEEEFRSTARAWLAENLPPGWAQGRRAEPADAAERLAFRLAWHRKLHQGEWLGLTWPREHGGRGLPLSYQLLFNEALSEVEAPPMASWVGLELVGPTLIEFGTPHQQEIHLRRILSGDELWCQGFSEPDAGSDLFAIAATATETSNGWRLNGRKKWTSWAQYAHFALILARTGPLSERHRSLTMFEIPMDSPGLTVVSTKMLDGEAEENELILDGVMVPRTSLVGKLNTGAKVLMRNMSYARGIGTIQRTLDLEMLLRKLVRTARWLPSASDPAIARDAIRRRLTNLHVRIQALKHLGYRKVSEMDEMADAGPVASVEKLVWSETYRSLTRLAIDILGPAALMEDTDCGDGLEAGRWHKEFFRSQGAAIEGGTDEIQKNTIAKRVLHVCVN